jgi:adenosylcobinamide-GDP ribazoletransferase
MKNILHDYFLAQSFLSRLPIPKNIDYRPERLGYITFYYPIVGALIGSILAIIASLLASIDPLLVAVLLTSIWAIITGALHLDGLADSADAWLGGHGDRQRIFEIMKDPLLGTAGVVSLVLILLLKVISLSLLLQSHAYFDIILIVVTARFAAVALLYLLPAAQQQGLAYQAKNALPSITPYYLLAVTLKLAVLAPMSLLLIAIFIYLLRRFMLRSIGGMTGDTLGASIEILEVVGLLIVSATV